MEPQSRARRRGGNPTLRPVLLGLPAASLLAAVVAMAVAGLAVAASAVLPSPDDLSKGIA